MPARVIVPMSVKVRYYIQSHRDPEQLDLAVDRQVLDNLDRELLANAPEAA